MALRPIEGSAIVHTQSTERAIWTQIAEKEPAPSVWAFQSLQWGSHAFQNVGVDMLFHGEGRETRGHFLSLDAGSRALCSSCLSPPRELRHPAFRCLPRAHLGLCAACGSLELSGPCFQANMQQSEAQAGGALAIFPPFSRASPDVGSCRAQPRPGTQPPQGKPAWPLARLGEALHLTQGSQWWPACSCGLPVLSVFVIRALATPGSWDSRCPSLPSGLCTSCSFLLAGPL